MVNAFIIWSILICDKNIIIAEIAKNGPNGISWVFFNFNIINDIGSAKNADKNIEIIDSGKPKTNPKTASSFISPPPIDSFLNKKSPNNFNNNIKIKDNNPFNNEIPIESIPVIKNLTNANNKKKNIKMLSGIIIV